ncbi:hypothetical protein HQ393_12880 [Chitinibacter bivalviorum]|uniref:Uncharacterized protein n=1 Tax=Chitinibacter bivalviorum TaxID=2739434 RepID=A0A7H9BLX6_9NEIS|nr:hypothetical protein [Chitinibacter bivalviorum]QLG89061.1 hypothetical protein HQ393_12880 [Chitinibacter bivalviorum]
MSLALSENLLGLICNSLLFSCDSVASHQTHRHGKTLFYVTTRKALMKKLFLKLLLSVLTTPALAVVPSLPPQSAAQSCFKSQTGNSIVFGDVAQQVRLCGNDGFKYILNINGRDKEFDARSCVSIVAAKINVTNGDVSACVSTLFYPGAEQ